ncbi:MAG: class II fumarate hydratase [Proteobacteria bacterium]|nr:class II fumarate hydratase [Pseudomonadota bacterium]
MAFRKEKDALGEIRIPEGKLWGAGTQRAVENFPISRLQFPSEFFEAFSLLKQAAAETNWELGLLEPQIAKAIIKAAEEIEKGEHRDHFPVDVFQTGSGTSTNMNFNEVIATLASQKSKKRVHPNDHVNKGQSSNDIFPSAIHVSAVLMIERKLLPHLKHLEEGLEVKIKEFKGFIKVGRTHLQDATPILLSQEFSGYLEQVRKGKRRVENALASLLELAVGGTAVGTGVNTHPEFGKRVCLSVSKKTGFKFKEATNHFEAQASKDGCLEMSGALKTLAVSLTKIANDLRWLACGPRAGISEINLPEVQPGSSIMPGKVNPVIPESLLQICAKAIGNDAALTWAAASGNFELNTMMPLIAFTLLESIEILANGIEMFEKKCVRGIQANPERMDELLKRNLMLATPLALKVGYDKAGEVAKRAYRENRTVYDVALEMLSIPREELDKILDPRQMLRATIPK